MSSFIAQHYLVYSPEVLTDPDDEDDDGIYVVMASSKTEAIDRYVPLTNAWHIPSRRAGAGFQASR